MELILATVAMLSALAGSLIALKTALDAAKLREQERLKRLNNKRSGEVHMEVISIKTEKKSASKDSESPVNVQRSKDGNDSRRMLELIK